MSRELSQSRSQRRWLEADERLEELQLAAEAAETDVARAIGDLVRVNIKLAEARREEDHTGREMLGDESKHK